MLFRFGAKSIKPKNIIIKPLILDNDSEFLLKKDPIFVAIAASEIKTIENPNVNCTDPKNLVRISFSDSENIARYPGTRGKTHGEINDRSPNKNAIRKLTSILFHILSSILATYWA